MPRRLHQGDPGFDRAFEALVTAERGQAEAVDRVVADILADVRRRGDEAVIDYTFRFDRQSLTAASLRIGADEIGQARSRCAPDALAALEFACARIEDYHRRQMPRDQDYIDPLGVRLGARWRAIAAVGLYVPGGTAAYPSSVLMNAVPARVAGVRRVAMTVPAPDGILDPLLLAAAEIGGVHEVYRIGGAQAIAALAFGTESIEPVDKIVGPGNVYVASAKRQVFGTVGIDMIAGPSEILVVADAKNDPAWIAADLLSQAEHDPAARAILVTDDANFADAVERAIAGQIESLPRRAIAASSWRDHGAIIVVDDLAAAPALIDRIAPEHLELAVDDAERLAAEIGNAGAIFLGRHTPEAVGDYVGGPNHVLPTSRTARFASGLGVLDFLKRSSILACDARGLRSIGPAAVTLARAEGLEGHARSIALRLDTDPGN
jgi:histidinol dehydrogenase